MSYQIFSAMEWIYPDTELGQGKDVANIDAARNASECFQILTDLTITKNEKIKYYFSGNDKCAISVFQLLPAHVPENCGVELFTTKNYDEVKDFVTKKAPFDVYEICRPLNAEELESGRVALFVRLDVKNDAPVGEYLETLRIEIGDECFNIPIKLKIYAFVVPSLEQSNFNQTNWLFCDNVAKHHGVEAWSQEHLNILEKYIQNQIDLRNDYLMIPAGKPILDEDGRVQDFDFSQAEMIGNLALKMGMKYIMGGFSIAWKVWNLPDLYLKWNWMNINEPEAQRQLHLYYKRCAECVIKNAWGDRYLQCVLDEVQTYSMESYAKVIKIVKEYLPNVKVHDPVETFDAVKYVDIMVSKQVSYEDRKDEFKKVQDDGATVWIYTCAFPAGKAMKRIIDLPLVTTRLPIWLAYKYGVKGFLCWGYNVHTSLFEKNTCLDASGGNKLQAGDGFIVYPGRDGTPWNSVRAHVQRMAMEDYELLYALGKKDEQFVLACIEQLSRNFNDYETDAELFASVRKAILEKLE